QEQRQQWQENDRRWQANDRRWQENDRRWQEQYRQNREILEEIKKTNIVLRTRQRAGGRRQE
ncbi:MAG: hypothetical protein AB4058_19915, partial [Microcystaceae cyanobacterium]